MTFIRSLPLASLLVLAVGAGGACSSSDSAPKPDASTGTGGGSAGSGGSMGSGGTSGSGGSAPGSGGQPGTGGAPASGGASGTGGSGGSAGSGGSGTGGTGGGTDAGPKDTSAPDLRVAPAMPTFAAHVAPIIATKCSPCHTTEAKAGYNWTYANLVTNSTVTTTIGKCGMDPGMPPEPEPPGPNAANKDCIYMEGDPKRVKPGANFEFGLLYIKIVTENGRLCDAWCGSTMPPANSGKTLDTYERDVFKNWMKSGARP